MSIQLFSVEHAPLHLPYWPLILDDLGRPPARRIARVLGVGVRTVYRWNHRGAAPRSAQLALYWLTSWGRMSVHAQATNDAMVACGYVDSLRRDVARLEANVRYLSSLANGAANDPVQLPRSPGGLGGTPR